MKVFIKTFGCRVNQVESEALLEKFKNAKAEITPDYKQADLCLLNTCSVTAKADRDANKMIRAVKRDNPHCRLVVTGCYAMSGAEKIRQIFPFAEIVFKPDLGKALFGEDIDWTVKSHEGKTRAFVKIQDGCDNFCSYCIVPYTRPLKTSKPKAVALAEIKNLIENGYKVIVLTGINIGNYSCPQTGADLADLIEEIFKTEGDFRIRFSSVEINTVTDKLIETAAKGGKKFCNYLHLPLQSGSEAVLKDMGRHYGAQEYFNRVQYIKSKFKNIFLYCDIIAGYPTETKENFEESLVFLDKIGFAGLHVFSYSPRQGTKAAALKQIPPEEIKRRSEILHEKDKALRRAAAESLLGSEQEFLAETFVQSSGCVSGVLSNFQRALIPGGELSSQLKKVKIIKAQDGVCYAEEI